MATAAQLTDVMKTLADPTRRAVFERIAREGEIAATGLVKGSKVSQPAVSQHLRALRDAGLVTERRDGRHIHYRVDAQGPHAFVRLARPLPRCSGTSASKIWRNC